MRDAVAATAALAVMLSALGARAQQPVPPPPGPPGAMQPGPMPPGPMPPQQPVPAPPSAAKAPQPAPPSAPFPPGAQPAPFPGAQPMPPGPGAAPRAPQAPGAAPPTPGMPGAPAPGMPPQGYPGYAPYGVPGYGQPYYPQPYYYYPPPVNVLPPAVLPYEEGEPVPMGYSVKTRPVRSMVIAGSVTFGATYLVSLLTASTVLAADSDDGKDLAPLFAPIVGPFITIGTSKAEGAGTLWLVLDGLAQTAGAVMLIYGLAAEEKYLQRTPQTMGFVENLKHPEVFVGPRTAALRWKF